MIYAGTGYYDYTKKIIEILIKVGFTKAQAIALSILIVGAGMQQLKHLEEKLDVLLGEEE